MHLVFSNAMVYTCFFSVQLLFYFILGMIIAFIIYLPGKYPNDSVIKVD